VVTLLADAAKVLTAGPCLVCCTENTGVATHHVELLPLGLAPSNRRSGTKLPDF
jgi:hypothetical protein